MPHFERTLVDLFAKEKIIGVRAGSEHAFTGVWVVVVEGRVFVRSWSDKPNGWFRAFRRQPEGTVVVGGVEVDVRGKHCRSDRLQRLVSQAYGMKYPTKGSLRWVTGFAEASRMATTLELVPDRSVSGTVVPAGAAR